ncbi:MAG: coproporphyrinogen-III oxidase family protein, partial [Puniceicoccales bacterium]
LLATPDMASLCDAVRERAPLPVAEWSVEMAPSTVKADKVRAMLDAGVTRISLGVQSFDERLLDALGRQHSPTVVRRAYDTLRENGCDNVNLDLIFAVPGQTLEQWQADLREAIALAPEHLSTYCLTFEEDTKLWVKLTRGELRRDIANEADLYRFTWDALAEAGYPQYEVSNFARPGFACQHNLSTGHMGAWRGVGPSAASQWLGSRWSNPADLNQWLAGLDDAPAIPPSGAGDTVFLDADTLAADALIFGLRLNDGINLASLHQRFPEAPWAAYATLFDQLAEEGLLLRSGEKLRLTGEGRLVADSVAGAILEAV